MIEYRQDGSVLLTDDKDPSRTQLIAAGSAPAEIEAAVTAFDPGPAPSVPEAVNPAWLLKGLVDNGVVTQAKADAVLASLRI